MSLSTRAAALIAQWREREDDESRDVRARAAYSMCADELDAVVQAEAAFSISDLFGEQAEDTETVAAITAIVREAVHAFETSGGSSRHWVRDQFLPRLNAHGWRVCSPPLPDPHAVSGVTRGET